MNSNKIKRSLVPFFFAVTSMIASLVLSEILVDRTWSNIIMFAMVDFTILHFIASNNHVNREKKITMCTLLAVMILVFSIPYSIFAYLYHVTNVSAIDSVYWFLNGLYYPASVSITTLLLITSVLNKELLSAFNRTLGIHGYFDFFRFCSEGDNKKAERRSR